MNILITAGGTSEKIDQVRTISNKATGRLGSMIADNFLDMEGVSVTYICPKDAITPQNSQAEIFYIDNVQSLQITIEKLFKERCFDAVVHSMAVSDYSVKYSVSSGNIAHYIAKNLQLNNSNINNIELISKQIHSALISYQDNDPIVQENIDKLKKYGYQIIEPKEARLACGDTGKGALADVDDILNIVHEILQEKK